MKTIILDTAALAQMVILVSKANDEIDEAAELMNRVVSHNDWTCKERTSISDGIQRCKKSICSLQEANRSFMYAFKRVLSNMTKKEQDISTGFQSVESILAKILGAGLVTSGVVGAASAISQATGSSKCSFDFWESGLTQTTVSGHLWQNIINSITNINSTTDESANEDSHAHSNPLDAVASIWEDGKTAIDLITDVVVPSPLPTHTDTWQSPFIDGLPLAVIKDYLNSPTTTDSSSQSAVGSFVKEVAQVTADAKAQLFDAANFTAVVGPVDFQNLLAGMEEK